MDFDVIDFAETIPAGAASLVDLREYFALVTGSGLQLRVKGHNGRGILIPLNFVFGDGRAPLGRAEIVNPTGAPVAFRLITSSVGFNASALSSTQNVGIVSCAVTLPVSGNFGGIDADGAVRTANPIGTAGYDGANMRALKVDTTGRPIITGAAAAGAAIAGNPVMIGGSDGANARALLTDATGRQVVAGAAAAGAAIAGNPVMVGGSDGANARALSTDATGRPIVVGAAAAGAAIAGNPVLAGGSDGANARALAVDTTGNQIVVGAAATGAAPVGSPNYVAGLDTSNFVRPLAVSSQGQVRVTLETGTTGGGSIFRQRSAASTNATSIKASGGKIYGIVFSNTNAAARYVKLYNKASAPTVGTDTPAMTVLVPAGQTVTFMNATGFLFGTGIALATTIGEADTDVAAVAAGDLHVFMAYA